MFDPQTQQLSPEMIQAFLALNQQQGQQPQIDRQLQMAQLMRQQGQQGMQSISPGGGRAGAPNWAGALANIYAAKKAGDMEAAADTQTKQMGADRTDAYRRMFEAMTRKQAPQQQQAPGGMFPGDGVV
jgi:hypothetical protein